MTSRTIARWWLAAVSRSRSTASTATATAEWKPNVQSVPEHVVVHRLRDADDPATAAGEFSRRRERIVPSDGDQHIDPVGRESLDDLLGVPLLGERVRSGAAQDRSRPCRSAGVTSSGVSGRERPSRTPFQPSRYPIVDVPLLVGAEDHGPDRGVKPGAIAPTRKDPELHAETSRYPRGAVVRNS